MGRQRHRRIQVSPLPPLPISFVAAAAAAVKQRSESASQVTLKAVSMTGCSAGSGAALAAVNCTVIASQLRISSSNSSNSGGGGGGAFAFVFSQVSLLSSTIYDNFVSSSSSSSAGAVACVHSTLTFRGVIMYNNGGVDPASPRVTGSDWVCSSCDFASCDFGFRYLLILLFQKPETPYNIVSASLCNASLPVVALQPNLTATKCPPSPQITTQFRH